MHLFTPKTLENQNGWKKNSEETAKNFIWKIACCITTTGKDLCVVFKKKMRKCWQMSTIRAILESTRRKYLPIIFIWQRNAETFTWLLTLHYHFRCHANVVGWGWGKSFSSFTHWDRSNDVSQTTFSLLLLFTISAMFRGWGGGQFGILIVETFPTIYCVSTSTFLDKSKYTCTGYIFAHSL